ncbi:hypothetical protein TIFTF001_038994 [Ficus carica]|uniref:Uncharacterized protein n=1 Tax=Ficus carica TaxID=3494 RepID=A0AA88E8A9_FICCA|nr:hypothetical protein TIFTF001_038994 [Ficus carica]
MTVTGEATTDLVIFSGACLWGDDDVIHQMSDNAGRGDESEYRHEPRNANSREMSSSKSDGFEKDHGREKSNSTDHEYEVISDREIGNDQGPNNALEECKDEDKPQKSDSDIEAS